MIEHRYSRECKNCGNEDTKGTVDVIGGIVMPFWYCPKCGYTMAGKVMDLTNPRDCYIVDWYK